MYSWGPACAEMNNGGYVAARKADGPDVPTNRSVGQEPEMNGRTAKIGHRDERRSEGIGVAHRVGTGVHSAAGPSSYLRVR